MKNPCMHCKKRVWWWQKNIKWVVKTGEGIVIIYYHLKCEKDSTIKEWQDALVDDTTTEESSL